MKCNVCGGENGLIFFEVNRQFGYNSSLDSMSFEFYLCDLHSREFFLKGSNDRKNFHEDDWLCFGEKFFNSQMVVDMLNQFQFVPVNYYNNDWSLYSIEEEQLMWERKEGPLEVLSYERILELAELFDTEYVSNVLSDKYPDKPNPYAFYSDETFEILLKALSKEDLVRYIKAHVSRDSFIDFFK